MRALQYDQFGSPIKLGDLPDPSPPPDGVVIEVMATGLCLSDWHGWQGHDPDIRQFPHVPGHELAGVIVTAGKNVKNWHGGERVTLPFVCGCGRCKFCHDGDPQVCPDQYQPGFTGPGSFAEYVAVPFADANLVALPDGMDFDSAALLGCRVVTAYRAIRQQARLVAGEWLAVFGCGGVGLSAVMFARAFGAKVIAVDIDQGALARASKLGASELVRSGNRDEVVERVIAASEGGADVTLDAFGSRDTLRTAIGCLRPRGRHVQVGLMAENQGRAELPMARIIAEELEILGSHGMAAATYPEVFRLIADNKVEPRQLLARTIGLEAAASALMQMGRGSNAGVTIIHPGK